MVAVVALPQLQLLLHVVGDHLLLDRPHQAQEVDLVPLPQVLLDAEVAHHVAAEEGEVVGHGDPAVEDLPHTGLGDGADDELLEAVLLVLELQEEAHDVADELVVLVALHPAGHLHVDLEVGLDYHLAVQQPRLPVALLEGEVAEVLGDREVALAHPLHQPDALQLPDDLLVLLPHRVAPSGLHQREAEYVLEDFVVSGASLVGEEALDEDGDLVPQGQTQEVEVLLAQPAPSQPPDAALP